MTIGKQSTHATFDILHAAADSIEASPDLYGFYATMSPDPECGSPGCALGWIAFHAGFVDTGDSTYYRKALAVLGIGEGMFYDLMDHVHDDRRQMREGESEEWSDDASSCAATLRMFAARYYSPYKVNA